MALRSIPGTSHLTPRSLLACAIVGTAMVLGGGGSSAPRSELLCELIMALAAAGWVVLQSPEDRAIEPGALVLAALVIALPVLQLIPLPPGLWQRLPGRGLEDDLLRMAGADQVWMPWTISPGRTAAALLATLPAAFVLCIAAALDRHGRRALQATIVVLGFVSLLLGALQLADGSERSWRFYVDNPGYLNGFQANRNAEVDVLLIALAAYACLLRAMASGAASRVARALLAAGGGSLLLLGCVLTGSRAGILIACLVVPALLLPWRKTLLQPKGAGAIAMAILVLCVVLVQTRGGTLGQVGERFTWAHDVRLDLWRDTLPALRSVWPAGGGIGTFRPLFEAYEPLSSVDPTLPVRAHDDYLEFLLEGGAAAIMALLAGLIVVASALRRAWQVVARPGDRPTLVFIALTFVIVCLHTFVDYPLRSMSLAVLMAASAGMLFATVRDGVEPARGRELRGDLSRG